MLNLDEIETRAHVAMISDEACMVPIGGGNPYYHCKFCQVTNVELNMGEHSRGHAEWCQSRENNALPNDVLALISELQLARTCIEEVRYGFDCVGHYSMCKAALTKYDKGIKKP